MTDEGFDRLMRDAAQSYNTPDEPPNTDDMWARIDAGLPDGIIQQPVLAVLHGNERERTHPTTRATQWWASTWMRMAAVLLVGVALGRVSTSVGRDMTDTRVALDSTSLHGSPDRAATSEYLGQTAALLTALPAELRAVQSDSTYLSRADDLLLRTRLLLDSPAASDPTLRSLFDDLEVVLAQVVRLNADRDPTRVDLLKQALEQRDVMPRLRDAAADNAAD